MEKLVKNSKKYNTKIINKKLNLFIIYIIIYNYIKFIIKFIIKMELQNLHTVKYRGITTISSFPLELVWGKTDTVLECQNCIEYGSYKNILIGLCVNCAKDIYNGKYGCGYYYYLKGQTTNDIPVAFGKLDTNDVINKLNIIYNNFNNSNLPKIIIDNNDRFTIYNLSLLSYFDINLLVTKNNDGWKEIKIYYNSEDDVIDIIIDTLLELKLEYKNISQNEILFDINYYNKCRSIEKFFKYNNREILLENNYNSHIINNTNNYVCNYCKIEKLYKDRKQLKSCKCREVKYCSIACQSRDWKQDHKQNCKYYMSLATFRSLTIIDDDEDDDEDDEEDDDDDTIEDVD